MWQAVNELADPRSSAKHVARLMLRAPYFNPKKHCDVDVIKSFIDDGLRPFQMPAHRYFISKNKEILSKYRKTCLKLFIQSWKLN